MLVTQTATGRLLDCIMRRGSVSRSEATTVTGLARSAVGVAGNDLVRLGLIRILPATTKTGGAGRPSPQFEINPDGGHVIAVNVRANMIEVAAVNLSRTILLHEEKALEVRRFGAPKALAAIALRVSDMIARAARVSPLCGIGIAVPGMVGEENTMARNVLALDWRDVPVASAIREQIGSSVAVNVGHDATFGALAEYRRGAGVEAKRLLYLTSQPTGVGSAMISRETRSTTAGDHTLQAGHLSVDPKGVSCACGSRGCLELYINSRALAEAVGTPASPSPASFRERISSMTAGERKRFLQAKCIKAFKVGLVSLLNTLAPDRVVLAGSLSPIAEFFPSVLDDALATSVVAKAEPMAIVPAKLEQAVLIGAAEQAFERLRIDPIRVLRG